MIGGTSSLGRRLVDKCLERGAEVLITSRAPSSKLGQSASGVFSLQLDVASNSSCEKFVEVACKLDFSIVLVLVGSLFPRSIAGAPSLTSVLGYVGTFAGRLSWVLDRIIQQKSGRELRVFFMSSRASEHGSWDEYYSLSKAAIDAFLKSKQRKSDGSLTIVSIVSGLIEGSGMSDSFAEAEMLDHRARAGGSLLTVEDASDEIIRLIEDADTIESGTVKIGPDYL